MVKPTMIAVMALGLVAIVRPAAGLAAHTPSFMKPAVAPRSCASMQFRTPQGAPPQQYGAPPQQQGGFGAPPQQQGGFGAPQQGGFGAPQQGGYGQQQQGGYPQQSYPPQNYPQQSYPGQQQGQQQQGYPGQQQQGYPGQQQQGGGGQPGFGSQGAWNVIFPNGAQSTVRYGSQLTLGRYDLPMQNPFVSREQCVVVMGADGAATVTSRGKKPTGVRPRYGGPWKWLYERQEHVLSEGDQIAVDQQNPEGAIFSCTTGSGAGMGGPPGMGGMQQPGMGGMQQPGMGGMQQHGMGQQQPGGYPGQQQQGGYPGQQQQGGYPGQQQGGFGTPQQGGFGTPQQGGYGQQQQQQQGGYPGQQQGGYGGQQQGGYGQQQGGYQVRDDICPHPRMLTNARSHACSHAAYRLTIHLLITTAVKRRARPSQRHLSRRFSLSPLQGGYPGARQGRYG